MTSNAPAVSVSIEKKCFKKATSEKQSSKRAMALSVPQMTMIECAWLNVCTNTI